MTQPDRRLHVVPDAPPTPALPVPAPDEDLDDVEAHASPPQGAGSELEPKVFDAELLDEADGHGAVSGQALAVRVVGHMVRVQPSEPAAKAARGALGAAVTVGQGWHSWLVRGWDALTMGVHRRQIRVAEATGDREALAEWLERKRQAMSARHERVMRLPLLAVSVAKFTGIGCLGLIVGVLLLSAAVWATGVGEFTSIVAGIGWMLRLVLTVAAFLWPVLLACLPAAILVAAWREGRRRGEAPAWLVAPGGDDTGGREVIPDEGAILGALRNLGLAKLDKAFKEGWRPRFTLPTERDGKGYHTQLQLPQAVTVEMINDKKKILAHNLVRFPVEVWPTEPRNMPGVLDLWVADQGSLTGPVDPWPLLHKGTGDYFGGVPVAVDIRGRPIIGRLFEANYAIAGMMGSGKSTLIINLLLGALLDPLVDADVFVMAHNADYDPMQPRLRTLLTGAGDEVVEACLDTLRGLYADLTVRGKALKEHGERAVTRELAEKDPRLRPRIAVVDECQALFMHETLGEEALDVAVKLENAARKYAVTLFYATPEPSTDSLPRRLITITSNRACFAIGDQTSNDAVLGTGSYKAGISAVGLEPKTDEGNGDVGTFMGKGFQPKPGLLRGYYVSQSQAGQVVERALKLREQARTGTDAVEESRDLLDDLDEVLGTERVRLSDVPALLRKLAPEWRPYETLTGIDLRDILTREFGVRVTNTGNVLRLDPADLRRVKALREAGE